MKILKSYKTELDPNDKQRTAFLKHAGVARWTYNWALKRNIDEFNAAINLRNMAASSAVSACRHDSSGKGNSTFAKLSHGQEPNTDRFIEAEGSVLENGTGCAISILDNEL